MDPAILFARAEQAFLAGRIADAHRLLGDLLRATGDHPAVLHLMALVEKRRGDAAAAGEAFAGAMRLDPRNAEIATNAGNFFLDAGDPERALAAFEQALAAEPDRAAALRGRAAALARLGRADEARRAYREMIEAAPGDARAWTAYAGFEREQGELDAAAEGYDRALALAPAAPVAIHGRARVALERGEADAPRRFAEAERLLPDDPHVALGAAEAMVAQDADDAVRRMESLTRRFPAWAEPHSALARLRWELGDRQGFAASLEAAVQAQPGHVELWRALVAAYAGVDLHRAAADAAARARDRCADKAGFGLVEAINAAEGGDLDRAEALLAGLPPVDGKAVAEARLKIAHGEIEAAARLLERARDERPDDMLAWAWSGLLWRLADDPRAEWLNRTDRLVQVRSLAVDGAGLEAIADHIASLHHARAFPIGQSLRGGTQTRGKLFDRLDPPVRRLRALIAEQIEAYWRALPEAEADHPLLRHRGAAPRFAGSWSVRLAGGGFHVAHIHPRGLLSSACYLRVPDFADEREGRLLMGMPPRGVELPLEPLASVAAEPGRLALFPSYLFHGTSPFGSGERLTVAFDVVA